MDDKVINIKGSKPTGKYIPMYIPPACGEVIVKDDQAKENGKGIISAEFVKGKFILVINTNTRTFHIKSTKQPVENKAQKNYREACETVAELKRRKH